MSPEDVKWLFDNDPILCSDWQKYRVPGGSSETVNFAEGGVKLLERIFQTDEESISFTRSVKPKLFAQCDYLCIAKPTDVNAVGAVALCGIMDTRTRKEKGSMPHLGVYAEPYLWVPVICGGGQDGPEKLLLDAVQSLATSLGIRRVVVAVPPSSCPRYYENYGYDFVTLTKSTPTGHYDTGKIVDPTQLSSFVLDGRKLKVTSNDITGPNENKATNNSKKKNTGKRANGRFFRGLPDATLVPKADKSSTSAKYETGFLEDPPGYSNEQVLNHLTPTLAPMWAWAFDNVVSPPQQADQGGDSEAPASD